MAEVYQTHLMYIIHFKDGCMYVGSHNGKRTYTKSAIISQSGCKRRMDTSRNHNWSEYVQSIEDVEVFQFSSEEEAIKAEGEKILELREKIGPLLLNRTDRPNVKGMGYYVHTEETKEKVKRAMQFNKALKNGDIGFELKRKSEG